MFNFSLECQALFSQMKERNSSLSQSVTVEHTSSADAASLTPTQRTMVFKIFKLLKKCNYFNFTLQFR